MGLSVVNSSEILVEFFLNYALNELPCLNPDGDINDDGVINTFDFIQMLSNMSSLDDFDVNTCLDLNADNNIDIIDLIMISDLVF